MLGTSILGSWNSHWSGVWSSNRHEWDSPKTRYRNPSEWIDGFVLKIKPGDQISWCTFSQSQWPYRVHWVPEISSGPDDWWFHPETNDNWTGDIAWLGGYIFSYVFIYFPFPYIYIFPYFACNPGNLIAFYKSSYLTAVNHRDKRAIFQSYVSLFFGVSIIGRLYPQFHIFPWDRYYIIFPSFILYYISIYFHGVYSLYILCISTSFHGIELMIRIHVEYPPDRNWKWKEPRLNQGFWDGKGFRWSIHGEIHWFVQPRRTAKTGVDSYWLYHITFWYLVRFKNSIFIYPINK